MSLPKSRKQLKDWVLRRLGEPVVDVNVTPQQCEDRICEAIDRFQEYHFDGTEQIWLKHRVTASTIFFEVAITEDFSPGELITGQTSGATAYVIDQDNTTNSIRVQYIRTSEGILYVDDPSNTFQLGEIIEGQSSSTQATIKTSNGITIGDIDNQYLPVDESVIAVNEILPFDSNAALGSGIFNVKYQFFLNNAHDLISTDITSYHMFRTHLALLDFELNTDKQYRFNRITGRIYLDSDWTSGEIKVDNYIAVQALKAVDTESYACFYSNWFVREYAYTLIKMQWGNNLKKYKNITLTGTSTVELNGQEIYDEAKAELQVLEEKLRKEFQLPYGEIYMG